MNALDFLGACCSRVRVIGSKGCVEKVLRGRRTLSGLQLPFGPVPFGNSVSTHGLVFGSLLVQVCYCCKGINTYRYSGENEVDFLTYMTHLTGFTSFLRHCVHCYRYRNYHTVTGIELLAEGSLKS